MLKRIMQSWDQLARHDPHWAILTSDETAGGRWDEARFFATGVSDVAGVLERLQRLGIEPDRAQALDFGCGLGRLTRALSRHFDRVDGVDISQVMVEKAVAIPAPGNVRFLHNPMADLAMLPSGEYAFILSLISLQHMPEAAALRYIDEMCRVLRPGGVAYLQVSTFLSVSDPKALAKLKRDESRLTRLYRQVRSLLVRPLRMDTYYCRLSRILSVLERQRVELVSVLPDNSLPHPFSSHVVVFRRPR